MSPFARWLLANLEPQDIRDTAQWGACWGRPGLIYTRDLNRLYDEHHDELWDLVLAAAQDEGVAPLAFIAAFRDSHFDIPVQSHADLALCLVWHGAEVIAERLVASGRLALLAAS